MFNKEENTMKDDKNDIFEETKKCFPYPVYRVVVMGTSGCGKTSLINKYLNKNDIILINKSITHDDRYVLLLFCC